MKASLFEGRKIVFRSEAEGNTYSECQLVCIDIWKVLTPVQQPVSLLPPPLRSFRVKHSKPDKELRGARIQVVPRVSVAYVASTYEGVRKDHNVTAWEQPPETTVAASTSSEWSDELESKELVQWSVWPPKRVAYYPNGEHLYHIAFTTLKGLTDQCDQCELLTHSADWSREVCLLMILSESC